MLRLYNIVCLLITPKRATEAEEQEQAVAMRHLRPSALQLRCHALCLLVLKS